MASLRQGLAGIGVPFTEPVAVRGSFGGRTPSSLRKAIAGMSDPHLEQWTRIGVALQEENTALSEEAQGVTTDGSWWYVCSNNSKSVVRFDDAANRAQTYVPPPQVLQQLSPDTHYGAPGYFEGRIYVPTQGPHGVWRFTVDGQSHAWAAASSLPDDDLFPWCAVHPATGVLYTCNYAEPKALRAYDRVTLDRRPGDDVALGATPLHLDKVQGAVFTPCGRLLMVRWSYNAVFVFSSLNGFCFGARTLGDYGSVGSEVESVTLRGWQIGGTPTPVHVMELDNDWPDEDDFYLHSYWVPDPESL